MKTFGGSGVKGAVKKWRLFSGFRALRPSWAAPAAPVDMGSPPRLGGTGAGRLAAGGGVPSSEESGAPGAEPEAEESVGALVAGLCRPCHHERRLAGLADGTQDDRVVLDGAVDAESAADVV